VGGNLCLIIGVRSLLFSGCLVNSAKTYIYVKYPPNTPRKFLQVLSNIFLSPD
jgi:hypothetical protein